MPIYGNLYQEKGSKWAKKGLLGHIWAIQWL